MFEREKMIESVIKKDCEIKDRVLIDLNDTNLTLGEVLGRVESYQNDPEYMNCEIFMDGDRFAIVARWKVCV